MPTPSLICRLLFLLFLAGQTHTALAQPVLYLGAQAGSAVPSFRSAGNATFSTADASGRTLGLFMRYGKRPFYQFGVNWLQGSESLWVEQPNQQQVSDDLLVNQFGVSAKIGYHLLDRPRFKWRASTGPYRGRTTLRARQLPGGESARNGQWSWQVGTGIDFFHFNLDFGYNLGLGALEAPLPIAASDEAVRMNILFLEVGIHL